MTYRIQLSLPAKKQLDRLDQVTTNRLLDRLKELALEPYSPRISKAVKMVRDNAPPELGIGASFTE